MSKKSDDSIERIFRQALTQYDTKFHESDWLKMEQLLNEEAGRKAAARSKRIKGTVYTLTGLTGLIIVVYFLAIKNPSGSIGSLSDSVTEMQASEDLRKNGNVKHENLSDGLLSNASPNDSIEPIDETLSSENSDAEGAKRSQPTTDKLEKGRADLPEVAVTPRPSQSEMERKQTADDIGTVSPVKPNLAQDNNMKESPDLAEPQSNPNVEGKSSGLDLTNEIEPSLTSPASNENIDATDERIRRDDEVAGNKIPATSSEGGPVGYISQRDQDIRSSDQNQSKANPALGQPETENIVMGKDTATVGKEAIVSEAIDSASNTNALEEGDRKIKPASRWSVGLILAPEFSTTSLSRYSGPGESFGLRIAYQISNRFSVSTGLIRSTKKYEDTGDSYKPRNPAYWQIRTNGVVPEEIDSKCLVYELPLGVQFDAIQTPKSRLFVSTAISSYFMISQAYDYTFQSPNPGADMGWRSPGSESYWFSVGMVSAGYERYIHRSFAIGIEPYLKISLSEIGWPNVKLFSTGAYVTLRYKFMSRRNF